MFVFILKPRPFKFLPAFCASLYACAMEIPTFYTYLNQWCHRFAFDWFAILWFVVRSVEGQNFHWIGVWHCARKLKKIGLSEWNLIYYANKSPFLVGKSYFWVKVLWFQIGLLLIWKAKRFHSFFDKIFKFLPNKVKIRINPFIYK